MQLVMLPWRRIYL